ncbi:MAG TPA: hypothetical protein VKB38_05010 [Terracidiphilus sp.]|nr:hypothetical protein [Terracidiphilus sp.]
MKRELCLLVSLFPICLVSAAAQPGAQQQLTRALDFIQRGRPQVAVAVLTTIAQSDQFSASDRGRAYALLGYAYGEEMQFPAAERSFTQAFGLLGAGGKRSYDYAGALSYYAGLLQAKGDLDAAAKAIQEAIELYKQTESHAELSTAYTRMASLEIARKKYKQARAFLAFARSEADAAGLSVPRADLDATSGWLDASTGRLREAVADDEAALVDCERQYGEQHMLTGWSWLLLGKAQESDNDLVAASRSMTTGLAILKATVGTNNIRYVAGQLAWSALLDRFGSHAEAARVSSAAKAALSNVRGFECADCTVGVWSLQHQSSH